MITINYSTKTVAFGSNKNEMVLNSVKTGADVLNELIFKNCKEELGSRGSFIVSDKTIEEITKLTKAFEKIDEVISNEKETLIEKFSSLENELFTKEDITIKINRKLLDKKEELFKEIDYTTIKELFAIDKNNSGNKKLTEAEAKNISGKTENGKTVVCAYVNSKARKANEKGEKPITKKLNKYALSSIDYTNKKFVLISSSSTAIERKARRIIVDVSDVINGKELFNNSLSNMLIA